MFVRIRNQFSYFSDFVGDCLQLEESVKGLLGYSAWDLGIEIRGISLTSNFCPIFPKVHSFQLYVQHPCDQDRE